MDNANDSVIFDATYLRDLDMVAVERRARELRAQAMADTFRALRGWIAARVSLHRGVTGGRAA